MRKYKRYERYKDSGVEWIGEIPEHWEIRKLKWLCSISTGNKDTIDKEDDGIYPFFVRSPIVERISTYSYDGEAVLTAGDGVGVGKVFHYINGKFDYHQRVYKMSEFKEVLAKYFYYYAKANFIKETEVNNAKSTVDSIRLPMIQQFPVAVPSIEEQITMIDFLDKKTSEIDDLIADKEKVIELLQEKRQAIISEAVTKGLNPDVRMKDSGVEWIGKIPEHWDIIPLKHLTNFVSRGNSPEYVEESSIKVINQACIYWDGLRIKNAKYQNDDVDFDKLKGKLYEGDLLLNSTGTGTLGRALVFRENGKYVADSHVTIIRFNKARINEVLAFYLLQTKAYQGYIHNALVTGATNQIELSREKLTTTPMIVPPSAEQQEIVDFLDSRIEQIHVLVNEINSQIQKLKEYRQSLISEAVTGKIDVRKYAFNS